MCITCQPPNDQARFGEQLPAAQHFDWFNAFASFDVPTSSARTQALLGWKPQQPGLIDDIDDPAYFAG